MRFEQSNDIEINVDDILMAGLAGMAFLVLKGPM